MGDIDNGSGESMPDEMTVTLWVDADGNVVKADAPLGKWPDGPGAWAATAKTEWSYSSEAWVQPDKIKEGDFHTLDQPKQSFTYLDCGRWGGPAALSQKAQRDFGIVCGTWTALCRFVPDAGRAVTDAYICDKGARIDSPINDLIDDLGGAPAVQMVKSLWASTPVTWSQDWNTIYVILPDMHLPVCVDWPPYVENMAGDGSVWRQYESDGSSMARVDYLGPNTDDEGMFTLRAGDKNLHLNAQTWIQHYLAGDIFGRPKGSAAQDLIKFLGVLGKSRLASRIHFVQVGDMYDLWIGLNRFYNAATQAVVLGDWQGIRAGDFVDFWVERTNKLFPAMIGAMTSLPVGKTSWLWGNHDNYLANQGGHTPGVLTGRERKKEIRPGSGIYIEHGQRGDNSNRDGETFGHTMTNQVFKNPILRSFDPNRRDYFTTTAAVAYAGKRNFCVYAMGHTHSPFLTRLNVIVKRYVPPPPPR